MCLLTMLLLALRLPDLEKGAPSSGHERLRTAEKGKKRTVLLRFSPHFASKQYKNNEKLILKKASLLLRRGGWSLVVGIHTKAAVAPHDRTLNGRRGE